MRNRKPYSKAWALALVLALAGMSGLAPALQSCPAGAVFSQRPTLPSGEGSVRIWGSDALIVAAGYLGMLPAPYDNFQLPAGATINSLTWWGFEMTLNPPTMCDSNRAAPQFSVTVYANDTSGADPMPGAVLSNQTVMASKVATGEIYTMTNPVGAPCTTWMLYQYTAVLSAPITAAMLTSGTGWVTIAGTLAGSSNNVAFVDISSVSAGGTSSSILGNMREYNGSAFAVKTGSNRDVAFCMTGTILVPNVVGMTESAATTAITSGGMVVGTVTHVFDNAVPQGQVMSQSLTAGSTQPGGTALDITVSDGPPIAVPDVVGMAQANAETAITAATLAVGTVATDFSPTVPAGDVISQNPLAGTSVPSGTAVSLVVSLGPAATVPDVTGMTQANAEAAITAANLVVGNVTQDYSPTVPAGSVISQNPAAGGPDVPEGTAVDLVISLGASVTVPDVVGQTQADAETAIAGATLVVGMVSSDYSDTVPEGSVISQNPAAGATVVTGSAVDIVVSLGPSATVPDVVGQPQADAETAITGANLAVGNVTYAYDGAVAEGSVISQNPVADTVVKTGSAVDLVICAKPLVPNVIGMTQAAAGSLIEAAGMVMTVEEAFSGTVPAGSVISQTPAEGEAVVPGTEVHVVVSKGAMPKVPLAGIFGLSALATALGVLGVARQRRKK